MNSSTDDAARQLAHAGIENPRREARLLWEYAEKLAALSAESLQTEHVRGGGGVSGGGKAPSEIFNSLLQRRLAREPMSQILGRRAFWNLDFYVNIHTLTPRPESETVVETALTHLPEPKPASTDNAFRLLDLGTGSGCLLLTLLEEIPHATGLGVDISKEALAVAQLNAERLGLASRAEFRVGNWAEGIAERFDMVVSNPPYIPRADIAALMPEVRDWEPHTALDGGTDGLDPYRNIAAALPSLLKTGGHAIFEIGIHQAADVIKIGETGGLTHRETRRDLSGIERVITFILN